MGHLTLCQEMWWVVFWKITLIIMFKFFNILKASIWQGVGPSALGHLPGLPWSLAERRRKKKHLAQGIDLTTNKTNPSGLNDPRMGLKISHQCLFQCNLDIIAPSWPATMPGLLWRRPTYTGLLPKDIDAMWGQIFTGLPLIGVWCGRRKMESGWRVSRAGLARRYWMAWDWI